MKDQIFALLVFIIDFIFSCFAFSIDSENQTQ